MKDTLKRFFAMALAMVMAISCLPVDSQASDLGNAQQVQPAEAVASAEAAQSTQTVSSGSFRLTVDGLEASSALLPSDGHVTLGASLAEGSGWQWEILLRDEGLWVDIGGARERTLRVGLATVSAALCGGDVASLRCRVQVGGQTLTSSLVQLQVVEPEEPDPEPGEMVILSDEVVIQEETEPTEPTTEATDPSTEATDPSTEATDPSTEATDPSTEATDPSTEATDPSTEATNPSTEATNPSTEATNPSTEATDPSTEATDPSTEATNPDTETTDPSSETAAGAEPAGEPAPAPEAAQEQTAQAAPASLAARILVPRVMLTAVPFAEEIQAAAQTENTPAENPIADAGDTGNTPADTGDTGNTPADTGDTGDAPADTGDTGDAPADTGDTGNTPADTGDNADAPADTGSSGGELITHLITVEYVNKEGVTLYSGFTAQVQDKAPFAGTQVVFPTILGYTPYFTTVGGLLDGAAITADTPGAAEAYKDANGNVTWGIQQSRMTIQVDSVTQDIRYRVVYFPNQANYTVSHYVQSMIGDDYVLFGVETKQGYVGELTDATDLVTDTTADGLHLGNGYIALVPFENVVIASDGTTQINTYYDRMYYLMRFKLGPGGRGVSPIYAQYESPIIVPTPTRVGYTFDGWDELQMDPANNRLPAVDSSGNFIVKTPGVNPPARMPNCNSAYQARWTAARTSYTVAYWLQEAPMYLSDLGKEMPYAFWCSTTVDAQSGDVITKADVKNPGEMGAFLSGAAESLAKRYTQFIPNSSDNLNGKCLVLVADKLSNNQISEADNKDGSIQRDSSFDASNPSSGIMWTFESAGGSTYRLHRGGNYLAMDGAKGNMSITDRANATEFTVEIGNGGTVSFKSGTYYINAHGGRNVFQGYNVNDANSKFRLYSYAIDHYYFSHFANEIQTVTVSPDGTTLINVYYKRKEYNLRFFYGREKDNKMYTYTADTPQFGQDRASADDLDQLLVTGKLGVEGNWMELTSQTLKPGETNSIVNLNGLDYGTYDHSNGYTYYYLVLKAKFGQRITELWPKDCLVPARRSDGSIIPFSAWTGEYWLKYEREHSNTTIKGMYAMLDENLLYDSSYDGAGNYADKGTGDDYLDFVAYWQFRSIGQFVFYIWTEVTGDYQGDFTTNLPRVTGTTVDTQSFGATPETDADDTHPVTVYRDESNGKLYRLARIIDTYDDQGNGVQSQTYPAVVGYEFRMNTYQDVSDWTSSNYFYKNTDIPQGYTTSQSLNFMYDAVEYSLELYSGGVTIDTLTAHFGESVPDLLSGTKADGEVYNYLDAAWMEEHCYPSTLPKGAYTFDGWYKGDTFQNPIEEDGTYPAKDMIINARWVPKKFNVRIFQTSDKNHLVATGDGGTMSWTGENMLFYGDGLPNVPADGPDTGIMANLSPRDDPNGTGEIRENWIFQCYAYLKEGVEHAIDVNTFTVTEDVDLYAKWSAIDIVSYEIDYVLADLTSEVTTVDGKTSVTIKDSAGKELEFAGSGELVYADGTPWTPAAKKDGEGKNILVAPTLAGKQNRGANRTFTAKTDREMNPDYAAGYYPLTSSHTLLMEGEDPAGGGDPLVRYSFFYVKMDKVPYSVYYLDTNGNPIFRDADNAPLAELNPKETTTIQAVVTENFKPKDGYAPDAFQKSLVLSANPAENVITFVYTIGTGSTFTIAHYFQTLGNNYVESYGGKNYTEYMTRSDTVEKERDPITFVNRVATGYEYTGYTMQYIGEDSTYFVTSDGTQYTVDDPKIDDRQTFTQTADFQIYDNLDAINPYQVTVTTDSFTITKDGQTFRPNEKNFYYQDTEGRVWKIQSMTYENGQVSFKAAPTSAQVLAGQYGTLIKIYYDLKQYPYTVNHIARRPDGQEEPIGDPVREMGVFQDQVTAHSLTRQQLIEKGFIGYRMDKGEKQITVTRNIQDDGQNPTINVINFYYYEADISFYYQPMVVTKQGDSGAVEAVAPLDDPNAHVTLKSESVKAVNGTASSSTAIWKEGAYNFLGWYLDEDCTIPAKDAADSFWTISGAGDKTIQPTKITKIKYWDEEKGQEEIWTQTGFAGIYAGDYRGNVGNADENYRYAEEKTFYALFAPKMGNLTIKRKNLGPDCGHNEANSFVYRIQQTKDALGEPVENGVSMYVTIGPGQDSVTIANLPFGKYTVTQDNSWSWRYNDGEQTEVKINDTTPYPQAVFNSNIKTKTWLSGFGKVRENIFGKP